MRVCNAVTPGSHLPGTVTWLQPRANFEEHHMDDLMRQALRRCLDVNASRVSQLSALTL